MRRKKRLDRAQRGEARFCKPGRRARRRITGVAIGGTSGIVRYCHGRWGALADSPGHFHWAVVYYFFYYHLHLSMVQAPGRVPLDTDILGRYRRRVESRWRREYYGTPRSRVEYSRERNIQRRSSILHPSREKKKKSPVGQTSLPPTLQLGSNRSHHNHRVTHCLPVQTATWTGL